MSKSLDVRLLRYFKSIVETGSFTKAARQLHIAQSSLSLHVREMEERLGVQLLVREPGGVRTTVAGDRLLEHARVILAQLALAEQDLQAERASPSGVVSIGIPSGAARVLIAPLLERARRELPRVTLHIVEAMTGHLQDWLASGRVQLAILYRDPDEVDDDTVLAHEEFYLISAANGAESAESVPLAGLAAFPLVLPSCNHSARRIIAAAAQRSGCHLKVDFEIDSLTSILGWVREGRAHSILAPAAFLSEWREGRIRAQHIVSPEVRRSVVLRASPRDSGGAATMTVERLVCAEARKLAASGSWPRRLR